MYLKLNLTKEFKSWQEICTHYQGDFYLQDFESRIWEQIRHYEYGAVPSFDSLVHITLLQDVKIIIANAITSEITCLYDPFLTLENQPALTDYHFEIVMPEKGSFEQTKLYLVGKNNDFNEQISDLASVKKVIEKIKTELPVTLVA